MRYRVYGDSVIFEDVKKDIALNYHIKLTGKENFIAIKVILFFVNLKKDYGKPVYQQLQIF